MASRAYRRAEGHDLGFVIKSWERSYKWGLFAGPIPIPLYHRTMKQIVLWYLRRPGIDLWVAHHPEVSPTTKADLHGFCAVEHGHPGGLSGHIRGTPIVHFVYVKDDRRGHGIAKELLARAGVDLSKSFSYTFKTKVVEELADKIPHGVFRHNLGRVLPEN